MTHSNSLNRPFRTIYHVNPGPNFCSRTAWYLMPRTSRELVPRGGTEPHPLRGAGPSPDCRGHSAMLEYAKRQTPRLVFISQGASARAVYRYYITSEPA